MISDYPSKNLSFETNRPSILLPYVCYSFDILSWISARFDNYFHNKEDRPDLDVEGLTQRFRGNLVVDGELPFRLVRELLFLFAIKGISYSQQFNFRLYKALGRRKKSGSFAGWCAPQSRGPYQVLGILARKI